MRTTSAPGYRGAASGVVLVVALALLPSPGIASAPAPGLFPSDVNIVPAAVRGVGNCIPFGSNTGNGFTGFIYRDVPAFTIAPWSRFAFDLGAANDMDVRRNIYFSAANVNPRGINGGEGIRAVGWTKLVDDSQVPDNPRGNGVVGDYELVYAAEAHFDFPGGGLIVGLGDSAHGDWADTTCDQVLVHTVRTDASGKFYARFFGKPDRTLGVLDDLSSDGRFLGGIVIETDRDSTPPVSTATAGPDPAGGWHDPPVEVRLSAADEGSGVAEIHYSVDRGPTSVVAGEEATVVLTEPGVHPITFWAVDVAGNVEEPQMLVVSIAAAVDVRVLGVAGPGSGVLLMTLSTADVDASSIDPSSVRFGATGSEESVLGCRRLAPGFTCKVASHLTGLGASGSLGTAEAMAGDVLVRGQAEVRVPPASAPVRTPVGTKKRRGHECPRLFFELSSDASSSPVSGEGSDDEQDERDDQEPLQAFHEQAYAAEQQREYEKYNNKSHLPSFRRGISLREGYPPVSGGKLATRCAAPRGA